MDAKANKYGEWISAINPPYTEQRCLSNLDIHMNQSIRFTALQDTLDLMMGNAIGVITNMDI